MCNSVSSYSDRTDMAGPTGNRPRGHSSLSADELSGWDRAKRRRVRIQYAYSNPLHGARRKDRGGDGRFPRFSRNSRAIFARRCSYTGPGSRIFRRDLTMALFTSEYSVKILRTRRHRRAAASTSETCHNN